MSRRHDLEVGTGKVIEKTRIVRRPDGKYTIEGGTPLLRRWLAAHLSGKNPFTEEEENALTEEQWRESQLKKHQSRKALDWLSEDLSNTMINECVPEGEWAFTSRMEREAVFPCVANRLRFVAVKIARGGITPTKVFQRVLQDMGANVRSMTISSQRVAKPLLQRIGAAVGRLVRWVAPRVADYFGWGKSGSLTTVFSTKGRPPVKDAYVGLLEQALSTGTTIVNGVPAALARCNGTPKKLIIGVINAVDEGIRAVAERFPDADIVVLCRHMSKNRQEYLDEIGCGDVGSIEEDAVD